MSDFSRRAACFMDQLIPERSNPIVLFRKKGRKIYTYRVKTRRVFSRYSPLRSALGVTLSAAVLIVLGIVGYSIIGPLVIRVEQEKKNPTTVPDPFTAQTSVTTGTTTTATTGETADGETTTTTTTTAATLPTPDTMLVLCLEEEAMTSAEALDAALSQAAAEGYHAVVMPLKQYGGTLYYASQVEGAADCGAVAAEWTAAELVSMATAQGLIPMAQMVTVADYCYPTYSFESGYFIEETGDRWLDDKESEGGKPWMNPFADASKAYLCALAEELSAAGFVQVLCADTEYPDFYASDLEYIGKDVSDRERRADGLAGVLNALDSAEASCLYRFDLYDALNKDEEAMRSEALAVTQAVVELDYDYFTTPFYLGNVRYDPSGLSVSEKTTLLLEVAASLAGDMTVCPCIDADSVDGDDLQTVLDMAEAAGFSMIFVS